MSPSLRFLATSIGGWTALRLTTGLVLPGMVALAAPLPPAPAPASPAPTADPTAAPIFAVAEPRRPARRAVPPARSLVAARRPAAVMASRETPGKPGIFPRVAPQAASPATLAAAAPWVRRLAPTRPLDRWDLSAIARPVRGQRLRWSSWALLRPGGGEAALASGGLLGGSQAGVRLLFAVHRRLDLSARLSAPLGGRAAGEGALGLRVTPLPRLPVAITLERRQRLGTGGGRDAFALFAEGGVYDRPLPLDFRLDGYAQAGLVGARRHDAFADGALSATRPLTGRLSIGAGAWGAIQPGAKRLDLGPRLTFRPTPALRLDLDWRQQLVGEVRPRSGPALTVSGNF